MVALAPISLRWSRLRFHATQQQYAKSARRFNVVPAGRRSGKTEIAKRRLVRKACKYQGNDIGFFIAAAPTRDQAKRIFWRDIKALVPQVFIKPNGVSDGALTIELINEAVIAVIGMDKPERVEGSPVEHIVMDEYGNMKKEAWPEHVRPALSDRLGSADLIGVPEGRNHYFDLYNTALADTTETWGAYHWISADILPQSEIVQAKADLDLLTYQQEYEASFVVFAGLAYYDFRREINASRPVQYDPTRELCFAFDFNRAPGTATVIQEFNGYTGIADEVHIPQNSTTPLVCEVLVSRYGTHGGLVTCFGDATGGAEGSAKVEGSDWALIEKCLRPVYGDRLAFDVADSNPRERVRVNSVNSRIKSVEGAVRLYVDPVKCPKVIEDFEAVKTIEGSDGCKIDKSDKAHTHLTDGIGYYITQRHSVAAPVTLVSQI